MTKWEYLQVEVHYSSPLNKENLVTANGKTIFRDAVNIPNLPDYFNLLGKDGWELVNFKKGWVYFFKRPLE
ncbi:MAG: hypothetical protein FJZ86_10910 [Chloroflexi bacterium]|nr:hypothetical protein [Chloroflexota bacterium]